MPFKIRPVAKLLKIVRHCTSIMYSWCLVGYGTLAVTLAANGFSWTTIVFSVFSVYVAFGGWRFIKTLIKTAPRDMKGLYFLLYSRHLMKTHDENNENVISLFRQHVKNTPHKKALALVGGESWDFLQLDEYSNRVANLLHQHGFVKNDVLCLLMTGRPEYVGIWMGMVKIGVVPALLNFNLRNDALKHCIAVSNSKALVYGTELQSAVLEIQDSFSREFLLFSSGKVIDQSTVGGVIYIDDRVLQMSPMPPSNNEPALFRDVLFYIYTSGTTGMPKAAIVVHRRYFYMSWSLFFLFKMRKNDIIYDSLPLYHSAGGILGIGQALINGCTVVIRPKFSASRFWSDCIEHNVTVAQYIGEICRYLLAQPPKPSDSQHQVRVVYGNGIRPQIWQEFQTRFGIQLVGEFYGATEGNANIVNYDNKIGAVGFTTRIFPSLYPVCLIKIDPATSTPLRTKDGLCILCGPGEPGELIGKIVKGHPLREFDGYVSKEATQKKVVYDVFGKGDMAFLTGDILEMDESGYLYFKDRTGDTFRWKGENVSTAEVEAIVSSICDLKDCIAYGVEVPGTEGRAGMIAIADEDNSFDMKDFSCKIREALPQYAQPVFIRKLKEVSTTGTFKFKKVDYRKEGFDPTMTSDELLYFNIVTKVYETITSDVHSKILKGDIRF